MAKYDMEMVLEYAKVFPENADMGDPEGNPIAQGIADKGGQYVVNAYFTKEEDIAQLLAEGMQATVNGHPRVIKGTQELGIGQYIKLKRNVAELIKTFTNNKGKKTTVNYGGPVAVVDLREGEDNKRWWSFEDDGPLGNGTKARVIFDVYSNGSGVRVNAIGVTEHVPYEQAETTSVGSWSDFEVA